MPEWFLWYGLKVGLSYQTSLALPYGQLLDLVAIEQIKHEGAKLKKNDEDEFWELLERR